MLPSLQVKEQEPPRADLLKIKHMPSHTQLPTEYFRFPVTLTPEGRVEGMNIWGNPSPGELKDLIPMQEQ